MHVPPLAARGFVKRSIRDGRLLVRYYGLNLLCSTCIMNSFSCATLVGVKACRGYFEGGSLPTRFLKKMSGVEAVAQ